MISLCHRSLHEEDVRLHVTNLRQDYRQRHWYKCKPVLGDELESEPST